MTFGSRDDPESLTHMCEPVAVQKMLQACAKSASATAERNLKLAVDRNQGRAQSNVASKYSDGISSKYSNGISSTHAVALAKLSRKLSRMRA